MEQATIEQCGRLLAKKKLTIAFAESATAGAVTSSFSLCSDSGDFLKGGLACYDACVKEELLKVDPELAKTYTPESPEVTFAIAKGLMPLIDADIHVGITGLTRAGGSETSEKPVGTIFFCAMFGENKLFEEHMIFKGGQREIIDQAVGHTAKLLLASIPDQHD